MAISIPFCWVRSSDIKGLIRVRGGGMHRVAMNALMGLPAPQSGVPG